MDFDEVCDDYDEHCCSECALFSKWSGHTGQCDIHGNQVHSNQEACPDFLPDDM